MVNVGLKIHALKPRRVPVDSLNSEIAENLCRDRTRKFGPCQSVTAIVAAGATGLGAKILSTPGRGTAFGLVKSGRAPRA